MVLGIVTDCENVRAEQRIRSRCGHLERSKGLAPVGQDSRAGPSAPGAPQGWRGRGAGPTPARYLRALRFTPCQGIRGRDGGGVGRDGSEAGLEVRGLAKALT